MFSKFCGILRILGRHPSGSNCNLKELPLWIMLNTDLFNSSDPRYLRPLKLGGGGGRVKCLAAVLRFRKLYQLYHIMHVPGVSHSHVLAKKNCFPICQFACCKATCPFLHTPRDNF